jgi:SHS2 domain-containing protein
MYSYHFEEHTADIGLKITADSQADLFAGALEGMNRVIKKENLPARVEPVAKVITVNAPDITALLIDFLSEVLSYAQEEKAIFKKVKFSELGDKKLKAEITGTRVGSFDEDIKAVTYYRAKIEEKDGRWKARLIFDI